MAKIKMMGKVIVVVKAILTRVIFAAHGLVAIWRATTIKHDPYYWYLTASILALTFEGVFTLTIKKSQEWKWFCPSVFCYLCSVVPAIWIIEVDKFDRRLATMEGLNFTEEDIVQSPLDGIVQIPQFDPETWATVIEQLLMLILIIGRWMLPKGGLTRDQLSQLLLVYIGTAADIIEFFDTFKEPKIAAERVLCLMILAIWSWSLLQFTFVLTATKARRGRITAAEIIPTPKAKLVHGIIKVKQVCCSIDVWAILINIILQDAPFLIFRLLLITYFKIITYMNVFFTCKNTLVIILQFYRLFVVQVERRQQVSKAMKASQSNVSSNLAKAIERAAFMGPSKGVGGKKGGGGGGPGSSRSVQSSRENVVGASGSGLRLPKQKVQDSVSFVLHSKRVHNELAAAAAKNRFKGRRKSLSTGNLRNAGIEVPPDDLSESDIVAADEELEIEESILSAGGGSRDGSDNGVIDEDDASLENERQRRMIRLHDNSTVYKISRSRSSEGSEDKVKEHYRQDTGYSSSSKESGHSSRRGRTNVLQNQRGAGGRNGGKQKAKSRGRRDRTTGSELHDGKRGNAPPAMSVTENERI